MASVATRGSNSTNRSKKSVFVTVGTTRFDALIAAVDTPEFAQALLDKGYTYLIIQAGVSQGYRPHRLFANSSNNSATAATAPVAAPCSATLPGGLYAEWFEYAPSLASYIKDASLVVSHAGAGSIFETLGRGTPLIAVPNAALMDNHQRELAEKLEEDGHLAVATPENLMQVVLGFDASRLKPYTPGNGAGIVARVDSLCGVRRSKIDF